MNAVAEPTCPFLQQKIETVPVDVGEKDGLTAVSAKNDVVKSAGKMNAWFACHVLEYTPSFQIVNMEA